MIRIIEETLSTFYCYKMTCHEYIGNFAFIPLVFEISVFKHFAYCTQTLSNLFSAGVHNRTPLYLDAGPQPTCISCPHYLLINFETRFGRSATERKSARFSSPCDLLHPSSLWSWWQGNKSVCLPQRETLLLPTEKGDNCRGRVQATHREENQDIQFYFLRNSGAV